MDLTFHGKDATIAGRVKTAASGRRIGRSFAMKKILTAAALLPVLCVSAGAAEEGDERVWPPVLLPPEGALAQMPPGLAPDAFAAALFAAGAVRSREIHVSRLDIPECTQYNKETIISC